MCAEKSAEAAAVRGEDGVKQQGIEEGEQYGSEDQDAGYVGLAVPAPLLVFAEQVVESGGMISYTVRQGSCTS